MFARPGDRGGSTQRGADRVPKGYTGMIAAAQQHRRPRRGDSRPRAGRAGCPLCFFQAEDGIRDIGVTGVQTCALPIFVYAVSQVLPLVDLLLVEGEKVCWRAGAVLSWHEVRLRVPLDADDAVDLVFQLRKSSRSVRVAEVVVDALGGPVHVLDRGQASRGVGELATRVTVFQPGVACPLEGLRHTVHPPP